MNWDAISAVSESIASVAVIISLIYLAQQIRHSNKLSQSQTRTELRQQAGTEVGSMIEHPDIWLLMCKDKLTAEEQSRLHSFLIRAIRFREYIWRQYKTGLLDKETFDTYIIVIAQQLSTKRNRLWWDQYKKSGTFDPEFVELVEKILAEGTAFNIRELMESL